jgi:hypothetical protein
LIFYILYHYANRHLSLFSESRALHTLRAGAAADHQVVVTNTGDVVGDCVVLGFAVSEMNHQGTNRDRAGVLPIHASFLVLK